MMKHLLAWRIQAPLILALSACLASAQEHAVASLLDAVSDETVLLQRPLHRVAKTATHTEKASSWPILVPLLRESVPVTRSGKTVSFKTSYSGVISVGQPPQEFRVVFDTGSGHVVLPAADCVSESCLIHRRYNLTASSAAVAINVDGAPVPEGELCDQATIGYGTGKVTGEFARDKICLGNAGQACAEVGVVMAVEMTPQPFKSFAFDGVFGLSLEGLAISPEFSFLSRLTGADLGAVMQFGVFLSGDNDTGAAGSEIALGGHNAERLLTPLQWTPVVSHKMGYWQVQIQDVRVGNKSLDICRDGSCRGIVDTGTSHLGVPSAHVGTLTRSLSGRGSDGQDCREVDGPSLELVLDGVTLTLSPQNYMRPLPLPEGVAPRALGPAARSATGLPDLAGEGARTCAPRIMPVSLPAQLGRNLFILGEPVLHRYYTVYDWRAAQIGFGLADSQQNRQSLMAQTPEDPHEEVPDVPEKDEFYSLMQVSLTLSVRYRSMEDIANEDTLAMRF